MSEFVSETAKKAGDRDLTKFEVMQIHAEYWQWSGKEITALRQQLADAKKENERVRQANLDVMMHFEDMKAAKEKAEARVAKLEAEALYLRARDDALVDFLCNESGVDLVSVKAACGHIPSEDAWLLRKQAEAVDDIRKDLLSDLPVHAISKAVDLRLGLRVDSLREKADEAGRAGGQQQ